MRTDRPAHRCVALLNISCVWFLPICLTVSESLLDYPSIGVSMYMSVYPSGLSVHLLLRICMFLNVYVCQTIILCYKLKIYEFHKFDL